MQLKPRPPKILKRLPGVRGLVSRMIADQAHTDDEIITVVKKLMPDKAINRGIIGACRSEMNKGRRKVEGAEPGTKYEQIVEHNGERFLRSDVLTKFKRKIDPENDPIAKLGFPPPIPKKRFKADLKPKAPVVEPPKILKPIEY